VNFQVSKEIWKSASPLKYVPGWLARPFVAMVFRVSILRGVETCWVSFMVKLLRAYGGCLGTNRRRRTWQAAISLGEPQAGFDPGISE
jgi:hypothetical protein